MRKISSNKRKKRRLNDLDRTGSMDQTAAVQLLSSLFVNTCENTKVVLRSFFSLNKLIDQYS